MTKKFVHKEFKTIKEANTAGVFSGTLRGGDTFGDEDDGPEGGFLEIDFSTGKAINHSKPNRRRPKK